MSDELYIQFTEPGWLAQNRDHLVAWLRQLPSFVRMEEDEVWLRAARTTTRPDDWLYDVRLFLGKAPRGLLEISAYPAGIVADLEATMAWLREQTAIEVVDEDGAESRW